MNETPKSDLKMFTTSDYDELLAGVGEMIGWADADAKLLLENVPFNGESVMVRNICVLDPERTKMYSAYLEFVLTNGYIYTLMKRLKGDDHYANPSIGGIEATMKWEPEKVAALIAEADPGNIDEGWDDIEP